MFNKIGGHTSIPMLSESIFSLLFSPTTPVCFDVSGTLSWFVKSVLIPEAKDMFAGFNFGINKTKSTVIDEEQKKKVNVNILSESMDSGHQNENENSKQLNDVVCLFDLNIPNSDSKGHIVSFNFVFNKL